MLKFMNNRFRQNPVHLSIYPALFLLVVVFLLFTNSSIAAMYYVSQEGLDSNSGLSWASTWRTLGHAGKIPVAGDTVTIRTGALPYDPLEVANSGGSGLPIVFRGSSETDPPLITGGVTKDNWKKSNLNGVWRVATGSATQMLIEDGVPLQHASSFACTDGGWFWSSDVLYYRPSSGLPGDHEVWRTIRGGGVNIGSNSWIVLENLECWLGAGAGVNVKGGSHNIIRNVHVKWHWQGIRIAQGATGNLVDNCLTEENREGIYITTKSSHNAVTNSRSLRNGNLPQWTQGDRGGILIGEEGPNIGNTVENCEIAYNGGPYSDAGLIAYKAPQTVFRNNHVHDNYGSGIFVTIGSDNSSVMNNKVENNGIKGRKNGEKNISGLSIRRSRAVYVHGNRVWNNHVTPGSLWAADSGPRGGLDVQGNADDVMDTIRIIDNVVTGTVGGPDYYLSPKPKLPNLEIRR